MRYVAAPALVLSVAVLAACGATRPFRCPARGGPPWHELATDHFVLRTNLDERPAATLAGRLERMRAAVAAALGGGEVPGRVEVIAFRTPAEFEQFAPPGTHGYYLRHAGGPPRIVLSGEIMPWQRALLAHELTHHFLAGRFPRQPRWLAEGLAVYMESLGEDAPRGAVLVGAPPPDRLDRASHARIPVRELLGWGGAVGARGQQLVHYASSWLLVHWLAHVRPEAFRELQRLLAAGAAPAEAWRAALPEFDPERPGGPEALDAILGWYVATDLSPARTQVAIPVSVGYQERPIPPAEVHAIRLALWANGPPRPEKALRAEVAEALAESPAHPVALQAASTFPGADAVSLARAAVAAHPGDPRAWTFLGAALPPGAPAEREAAYRQAAELAPGNPAALHHLASELAGQDRPGEALPVARRAAELAPWSPPVLAGYASVLSALGRCAQAVAAQQRALDVLPEGSPESARLELETRLAAYAGQCP